MEEKTPELQSAAEDVGSKKKETWRSLDELPELFPQYEEEEMSDIFQGVFNTCNPVDDSSFANETL